MIGHTCRLFVSFQCSPKLVPHNWWPTHCMAPKFLSKHCWPRTLCPITVFGPNVFAQSFVGQICLITIWPLLVPNRCLGFLRKFPNVAGPQAFFAQSLCWPRTVCPNTVWAESALPNYLLFPCLEQCALARFAKTLVWHGLALRPSAQPVFGPKPY